METTALLAIILVVFFSEWREHKLRIELAKLAASLKDYADLSFGRQETLDGLVNELREKLLDIEACQLATDERSKELLNKLTEAQVDLATIVQEYEINGIWLGKDRNKGVDAYEG